ncbi:MAG: chromate transporter [Solobacterium sp.]|nr:chromate transporter [Solobacterium sp.]
MKEYWDLFVSWFKMGLFTFGGGYAMLPMIQKEVIEKHGWATEDEVMDYYAIGQCTPGIIAVNAATFIGYKIKGVTGGIVATFGVVAPSLIIISLISTLITNFSELEIVQQALRGIQVAVCVLMFVAVEKLFKKGVKDMPSGLIFVVALLLSLFTNLSTVILVILAGLAGYVTFTLRNRKEGEQA